MLGKRIINTATGAAPSACTTDTVQILDGSPFQSIATYQLDGNANDLTTNYNGTASSVTYTTGQFGQAAVFSGSSRIDVNISLTGTKSFSFWFQDNGLQTSVNNHFFSSTQNNCNFVLNNVDNSFALYDGSSTQTFSYTVNDSNWHHIVLSIDDTTATLYVDNGTGESITINSSSLTGLKFGTNQGNGSGIVGELDQLRIYNKALSTSDVTTLYNETVSTASTNPTFNGPSCVAYYKMADATDETGSYDGTPTNVNFNVAGKFGNAGEFNGSSSYITTPSFFSNPNTNSSTFSAWFNTSINDSNLRSIAANRNGGVGFIAYDVYTQNGALLLAQQYLGGGGASNITGTTNIADGNWHNVTVVLDNSNGTLKMYLDGSQEGTTYSFTSGQNLTQFANTLYIGKTFFNERYWNGSIDQVRIFNRAITANEVETLYDEVQCIPTIVPSEHFNPVLYTGDGTTNNPITSLDFQPDLVWIKNRNSTQSHRLYDSVRGANLQISSNQTAVESNSGGLTSFDSNGFSLDNWASVNTNNNTYVAWNWKAGGAAVLNEDGTIDSQVSANVDAGFSIVEYTGGGTATVGHGLSSAPELIITKNLDISEQWFVYAEPVGTQKFLGLNTSSAAISNSGVYTSITDNTFTNLISSTSRTYINYCFHSVDGYSKIGSYVGTGSTVNVVTGFEPAMIIIKRTDSIEDWKIIDNKRGFANSLEPNESIAEETGNNSNFVLSGNGFTIGDLHGDYNANGGTYIFMAFAEEVFVPITRNATDPFGDGSELALYKFEDNANDAEGSYNGTASNVTYATGYIDKAAVFNGSSSYISVPNSAGNNMSTFSVSLWFKISNASALGTLISNGLASDNGYYLAVNVGGPIVFLTSDGNSNTATSTSPSTYADGNWHNVVLAYTAVGVGTSTYNIYVDGNSTPVITGSNGKFTGTSSQPLTIGKLANSSIYHLNGSIDQVRIFNRALDAGEVTQLYNE